MKQIAMFFAIQVLRRKSDVCIFKVPQGDGEWNSKWRKDTNVCERHYSKYQLIKIMYKTITSVSAEII